MPNEDAAARQWALRRRLAPLGVPTVIHADDAGLLETACEAYANWLDPDSTVAPVLEISLEVGPESVPPVETQISVAGPRLTLSGAGIAGWADAPGHRAHCVVPRRLIGDSSALADEVTDTLLLFLLARTGRTPLHAAGIVVGESALVLAGPSGSGKSTIALAAVSRGLPILSDDTLYIQLQPSVRVWGFRRPLHVFPKDAPGFNHATRLRAGKRKAIIPPPPGAPAFTERASLVLLEPGDRLQLTRLDEASAISGLARLDAGFDLLPGESAAAAQALASHGAWRLILAKDPAAAVDFLLEQVRAGFP